MDRVLLIVNSHAGGGRSGQRLRDLLASVPDQPGWETVLTSAPGAATEIARAAAADYGTLAAVGGDGTVGEVATGILSSGSPGTRLAILPAGTGNDAAQGLGIPDWDAALAALRGHAVREVDVLETEYRAAGETRRRFSLVGVAAGYPAEVVARSTRRVKRVFRRWAYYYAAVTAAARFESPTMCITVDGQGLEGRYLMAGAANVEFTGGHKMRMAPGARCDDGFMHVLLIRDAAKLRLLTQLPTLARGAHVGLPEVQVFRAREMTVESRPPSRLNIDGDLEGETPLHLTLRPSALAVRMPGP